MDQLKPKSGEDLQGMPSVGAAKASWARLLALPRSKSPHGQFSCTRISKRDVDGYAMPIGLRRRLARSGGDALMGGAMAASLRWHMLPAQRIMNA